VATSAMPRNGTFQQSFVQQFELLLGLLLFGDIEQHAAQRCAVPASIVKVLISRSQTARPSAAIMRYSNWLDFSCSNPSCGNFVQELVVG